MLDRQQQIQLFKLLAIRDESKLYCFDFVNSALNLDNNYDYNGINILQMYLPIYAIFHRISDIVNDMIESQFEDEVINRILGNIETKIRSLQNLFFLSQATGIKHVCDSVSFTV